MKKYNEKKVCFILCTNNELQKKECIMYLNLLEIPKGFEVEILTISDAESIVAGYNEGMNLSDAKYKIYLHQDTFIVEEKFIEKIVRVFRKDSRIGMIGIVGAERLSKDGIIKHEKCCGNMYGLQKKMDDDFEQIKKGNKQVEVIEGFLMATQYDIPWREDIVEGWDFYDVSQCMEFQRAGYKIVVPAQKEPWVIHSYETSYLRKGNENKERILREYSEIVEKGKKRLHIAFFMSENIKLPGLAFSMEQLGHNVKIQEIEVSLNTKSEKEVEKIEEILEEGNYDLAVTHDFSVGVAEACKNTNIKYYAWVYDCPLLALFRKEAMYKSTYITVFDKKQYEQLKKRKIPHLYYLPLAPEGEWFRAINISKKDEKKYTADVCFVGRLYDKRGYEELFDESNLELKKEADKVVSSCNCCWDGKVSIFDKASDELIWHIASKENEEAWKVYDIDKRYYCESMKLAGRCNEIERTIILNEIAKKNKVVLYSDSGEKKMLKNITVRPWLDYYSEMPKVFYLSKINLNITSRSIESGIPQRIWDILSVGGFCLTNYQPELEDYFEIGKNLVVYHNLDELIEKIDYYLSHEKERVRIAMNGYLKVKEKHEAKNRLNTILKEIFPEELA